MVGMYCLVDTAYMQRCGGGGGLPAPSNPFAFPLEGSFKIKSVEEAGAGVIFSLEPSLSMGLRRRL